MAVPANREESAARATIEKALRHNTFDSATGAALITTAKSLFYKDRTWDALFEDGAMPGISRDELNHARASLPEARVDQKRIDALALLNSLSPHLS